MLSDAERKQISKHPLLRGVSPTLIFDSTDTESTPFVAEYSNGEAIQASARVGFLLSGKASVQTVDQSKRVLLRFLSVGDAFGVAGIFSKAPQISQIRAVGRCKCLFFTQSAVNRLLDVSPEFRKNYIEFLSDRIAFLNQKITYLTAGSAERRLALYLLSFGAREVTLKDSIGALSELLNLGRASLYRAFDKLCEDGYLQKNGRKITVLNSEAMRNAYK